MCEEMQMDFAMVENTPLGLVRLADNSIPGNNARKRCMYAVAK
jgi:hypothetical protein